MAFEREINRLLLGLLIAFIIVAAAGAYWAITGSDSILLRDDNPRRVLQEASLLRGDIYDRTGDLLVTSIPQNGGAVQREYRVPSTYSALGYYSFTYGVNGAEAAYDAILRGQSIIPSFLQALTNQLLHRPVEGSDVQLTFDAQIQTALADAMNGQRGAAILINIPSGDILAMVSLPTFDPNILDANWDSLSTEAGNPFFNRALQGRYQPGSVLETPLIAAALLVDQPIDEPIINASAPYQLDDLTLTCAVPLPAVALSLREAYGFACPNVFAQLTETLDVDIIQATFDTFQVEMTPTLDGFVTQPDNTPAPTLIPVQLTADNFVANALGQGEQTVTPLMMAMIAAAIVNDGNTPQPNALLAVRAPNETTWTPSLNPRATIPLTTAGTARRLQDLMRGAVAAGAAQNAGRPNIDIGGHAALAYSGDSTLAWFIGFATLGGSDAVAIAVVLENSNDPGLAADIGGAALQAAGDALRDSP